MVYKEMRVNKLKYCVVIIFIYVIVANAFFERICPFLIFTGVPCAGCGMTRAMIYILCGNIFEGLRFNPSAPLWIIYIGYIILNMYKHQKKKFGKLKYLFIICTITMIMYLYRLFIMFPDIEPMNYYPDNLLSKMFPVVWEQILSLIFGWKDFYVF